MDNSCYFYTSVFHFAPSSVFFGTHSVFLSGSRNLRVKKKYLGLIPVQALRCALNLCTSVSFLLRQRQLASIQPVLPGNQPNFITMFSCSPIDCSHPLLYFRLLHKLSKGFTMIQCFYFNVKLPSWICKMSDKRFIRSLVSEWICFLVGCLYLSCCILSSSLPAQRVTRGFIVKLKP